MTGETISILVVDDDRSVCNTVVQILRANDYSARAVYSESEAKQEIRKGKYDLVVTDMRMENERSGHAILHTAKEEDPLTEVIVLTGYAEVPDAVKAMQEGAFNYFQKDSEHPTNYDMLVSQVGRARLARQVRILQKTYESGINEIRKILPGILQELEQHVARASAQDGNQIAKLQKCAKALAACIAILAKFTFPE